MLRVLRAASSRPCRAQFGVAPATPLRFFSSTVAARAAPQAVDGLTAAVDAAATPAPPAVPSLEAPVSVPAGSGGLDSVVPSVLENGEVLTIDPALIQISVGGPIDLMTYILNSAHNLTGLPWWATLAMCTLTVRTCMVPLVVKQMGNVQRLQLIKKDVDSISEKMKAAQQTDPQLVQHYAGELGKLFKTHNCHPLKSLIMPVFQIPIFMSFFFAIQRIAADGLSGFTPEQIGFTTGGLFHITDLSLPDPYFIMPVVTSATMLAVIELGADGNQPMAGTMKMVMRGMSLVIIPFTASMPSGLFCYWMMNNMFSLGQVSLLKIPPIRDAVGLLPASALPQPEAEKTVKELQFATAEQLKQGQRRPKKKAAAAASDGATPH